MRERVGASLCLYFLPLLLANLVQEEMTADMEHLYRLLVISLESCSRKEHVSYLSKSQSCVWL